MATNTNHTAPQSNTHATTETHASPEPGKFDKVGDMIKSHLFEIGLIVAGVVTVLALQASGFHGAFVYDDDMGKIVGIFNLLIMAYTLILAIKHRNGLRIGIIVVTIVFAFFAVPLLVRASGTIASAVWLIPFIGSVIIPVLAVFLNMVAAYLLLDHQPKGPDEAVHDKTRIDGLKQNVIQAETEYSFAENAAASKREAEQTAKVAYEKSDKKSKACAKAYQTALQKYATSAAKQKLAKLKTDLTTNENAQKDVQRAIEGKELEKKRATTVNAKQLLQTQMDNLDAELGRLILEGSTLNKELETAQADADDSPEKLAMDDTLAASDTATKATAPLQEAYEAAIKRAKKADGKSSVAASKLEKCIKELDDTNVRFAETQKSQRSAWRDVSFLPIVILIGAFVCYPVWYGWVLVTFH